MNFYSKRIGTRKKSQILPSLFSLLNMITRMCCTNYPSPYSYVIYCTLETSSALDLSQKIYSYEIVDTGVPRHPHVRK